MCLLNLPETRLPLLLAYVGQGWLLYCGGDSIALISKGSHLCRLSTHERQHTQALNTIYVVYIAGQSVLHRICHCVRG